MKKQMEDIGSDERIFQWQNIGSKDRRILDESSDYFWREDGQNNLEEKDNVVGSGLSLLY